MLEFKQYMEIYDNDSSTLLNLASNTKDWPATLWIRQSRACLVFHRCSFPSVPNTLDSCKEVTDNYVTSDLLFLSGRYRHIAVAE